jgi:hypothetical protein
MILQGLMDDENRLTLRHVIQSFDDRRIQRRHFSRQPRREVEDLRPDRCIRKPRLDTDAKLQPIRIPVAVFIRDDASESEKNFKSKGVDCPIRSHKIISCMPKKVVCSWNRTSAREIAEL